MKKNSIKSKKRINKTKLKNRQIKKNRHLQKYNTRKKIIGGNASEIKRLLLEKLPEIKTNLERLGFPQIYNLFFSRTRIFKSNFDKTVQIFLEIYITTNTNEIINDINDFIQLIFNFFTSNKPVFMYSILIEMLQMYSFFNNKPKYFNPLMSNMYDNNKKSLERMLFNGRLDILSESREYLFTLLSNYINSEKNNDIKKSDLYQMFNFLFIKEDNYKTNIDFILDSYTDEKYKDFLIDNIFKDNRFIIQIIKSYDEFKEKDPRINIHIFNMIILNVLINKDFIDEFIYKPSTNVYDFFIDFSKGYINDSIDIYTKLSERIVECRDKTKTSNDCCSIYPKTKYSKRKINQHCINLFDTIIMDETDI
jgi:hypothetical protein